MKKLLFVMIACLLAVAMLAGCGVGTVPAEQAAPADPAPAEEAAPADDEQIFEGEDTGMPSPMHECADFAQLMSECPGIVMNDAPRETDMEIIEPATDITYCWIEGDPVIAQIEFVYNGHSYTYRAAVCASEADMIDISGVYEEFDNTEDLQTAIHETNGGAYTMQWNANDEKGVCTWYYDATGCQYSLWTPDGCNYDLEMEEVVDYLLPIAFLPDGTPMGGDTELPAPNVAGTVEGAVIGLDDNSIVINMANGNTLTFIMTYIETTDAKLGDTVTIEYTGDITDTPEAVSITVTKSAPAVLEISGDVASTNKTSVYVKTSTGNTYGFVIDGNTKISGESKTVKSGQTVKVTYTGDLTNLPVASEIKVVKDVKPAPAPTEKPVPTNKTLNGYVTTYGSKTITMFADNNHTYSFVRTGSTQYTGSYSLEVGAYIKVTYDGYASDTPAAKIVCVLAPPDPTPPQPAKHTISGEVIALNGNSLVIETASGVDYSFLLRSPSIEGDLEEGAWVKVTYVTDAQGDNVTRIVVQMPGPLYIGED